MGQWLSKHTFEADMTNAYAARVRGREALAAQEKRVRVKELYELNFTDDRIAQEIGIERSRVTKLRSQMGLPPRWGKKNGFSFSPRQDADLMELKRKSRLSWQQIGMLIDNCPVHQVYGRYQLLLTAEQQIRKARPPEKILCRQCKNFFLTPNRRQIHMCDACHTRIESMGSFYDF